jgi:hypothetical protein
MGANSRVSRESRVTGVRTIVLSPRNAKRPEITEFDKVLNRAIDAIGRKDNEGDTAS